MAKIVGRAPEQLTIDERLAVAGQWAALELYTPKTLPARTIAALGATVGDCIRQLRERGAEPERYEFVLLTPPFA